MNYESRRGSLRLPAAFVMLSLPITCSTPAPVPHCRIAPRKVSPGRQFTGKNPRSPVTAPAERIFAGKYCQPGETSLGSDPIMGETFLCGRRYFNKGKTYQFRDYLSTGGFFIGRHFNVTPAGRCSMTR